MLIPMHEFKIVLALEKGVHWPSVVLQPSAVEIESSMINDYKKTVSYLIVNCKNSIQLYYGSKESNETVISVNGEILHDQTVEIAAVYVDDILLNQQFLFDHSKYTPKYNLSFVEHCAENNIMLITEAHSATKFWHNGHWTFNFEDDFWAWYYSKRKHAGPLSGDQISKYIGQLSEQIQSQLSDLKKYLT
jgi:hypothetical protein